VTGPEEFGDDEEVADGNKKNIERLNQMHKRSMKFVILTVPRYKNQRLIWR